LSEWLLGLRVGFGALSNWPIEMEVLVHLSKFLKKFSLYLKFYGLNSPTNNTFNDRIDFLKTFLKTKIINKKDICGCVYNFDTFRN
jgi:uncharacterized protein YijF (DUF1287 family)